MDFAIVDEDIYFLDNKFQEVELKIRLAIDKISSVQVQRIPQKYDPSLFCDDYEFADQIYTDLIIFADDTVEERVLIQARKTAEFFVNEFNEPLDSAGTDWDAVAWEIDSKTLFSAFPQYLQDRLCTRFWESYSQELEYETARLCK